jgi:hypothetical protein
LKTINDGGAIFATLKLLKVPLLLLVQTKGCFLRQKTDKRSEIIFFTDLKKFRLLAG